MHYTILASLFLHGSTTLAAPNVVPDACASVAELIAENVTFHASYSSPIPSQKNWKGQTVSFRLVNPILDYKPDCSAESDLVNNFIHRCDNLPAGHGASFTFDRDSYEFHVNQTWNCPSEGHSVEVSAGVHIPLSCVNRDVEHDVLRWRMCPKDYFTGTVECDSGSFRVPTV